MYGERVNRCHHSSQKVRASLFLKIGKIPRTGRKHSFTRPAPSTCTPCRKLRVFGDPSDTCHGQATKKHGHLPAHPLAPESGRCQQQQAEKGEPAATPVVADANQAEESGGLPMPRELEDKLIDAWEAAGKGDWGAVMEQLGPFSVNTQTPVGKWSPLMVACGLSQVRGKAQASKQSEESQEQKQKLKSESKCAYRHARRASFLSSSSSSLSRWFAGRVPACSLVRVDSTCSFVSFGVVPRCALVILACVSPSPPPPLSSFSTLAYLSLFSTRTHTSRGHPHGCTRPNHMS